MEKELIKPYKFAGDVELLEKLGLKQWECRLHKKKYIGKVVINKLEKQYIKIWVSCHPAQFYDFEVFDGSKIYKYSTGSGSLSNYWKAVELIANNMLVCQSIN